MITQGYLFSCWRNYLLIICFTAVLSACATPNGALQQAREAYEKARQDAEITTMAPVELHKAGETVKRAEKAGDQKETAHLANIAQTQVDIAHVEAKRKAAELELERLLKERDRILLEARTQEVEERTQEARALADELAELKAKQTDRGYVMTLGDVLFDYNRATLRSGAQNNLYRLVSFLKAHPAQNIIIEGHTDSTGSESYNLDLSERRANAVRNFLISNGINPMRMMARGLGESYPVASNSNEAGRQQNRRVEIIFPQTSQGTTGR